MEALLFAHGDDFWGGKIRRIRQIAQESDGHSVVAFLGLLGGMGSLNDVVLTVQSDPDKLSSITMPRDANRAFDAHRTRACDLARKLR